MIIYDHTIPIRVSLLLFWWFQVHILNLVVTWSSSTSIVVTAKKVLRGRRHSQISADILISDVSLW